MVTGEGLVTALRHARVSTGTGCRRRNRGATEPSGEEFRLPSIQPRLGCRLKRGKALERVGEFLRHENECGDRQIVLGTLDVQGKQIDMVLLCEPTINYSAAAILAASKHRPADIADAAFAAYVVASFRVDTQDSTAGQ